MAKTKSPKHAARSPGSDAAPAAHPKPATSQTIRETVESIVIAFVLAFLFRTFEAEAFVIPTGSMAPTLMGRHRDVDCPKCGHRFPISDSEERDRAHETVGGACPMCRYIVPVRTDIPDEELGAKDKDAIERRRPYSGDRILVSKYLYAFRDPQRWDVVVFKFPGNAQINYIKRLVGLPGETLRIFGGDLFVGPQDVPVDADFEAFEIARKPPHKVLALSQLVHDTDYDPSELYRAGWPLRWQGARPAGSGPAGGWQLAADASGETVAQEYRFSPPEGPGSGDVQWIRYMHFLPSYETWQRVEQVAPADAADAAPLEAGAGWLPPPVPQLISDFTAYNARVRIKEGRSSSYGVIPDKLGRHWVGDLLAETDVAIESAQGELIFDLVEAGRHFQSRIDLASGEAQLGVTERGADGELAGGPLATWPTPLGRPGEYHVRFANVDDQLLLWVDDALIGAVDYDAEQLFGGRLQIVPRADGRDPGDLAPVGIGAAGARLAVNRLQVWRDNYYIASSRRRPSVGGEGMTDFDRRENLTRKDFLSNPDLWDTFASRRWVQFPIQEGQLFVMGDNSGESSDARLWAGEPSQDGGLPGGDYLDRRLLTGRALCVYWPHSWNRIPGTPIPFPLFPNFSDMRLVR